MVNAKVNIVISTYNGENYIREQIDSLLKQEYPNLQIYIRDDGSKDNTVSILKEYEQKGKISLIIGENLGFCGSFMELIKIATDGEYWSFCDQDDIWYPKKISRAVECLIEEDQSIPLLYHSASEMIDVNGESLGILTVLPEANNFRRNLTGTFGVGFSMVINKRLRDEMLKCDYKKVFSHDWLAGAIAEGFGKVIVDEEVLAKYRRLDVSVSRSTFGKRIKWFKEMLSGEGEVKSRNLEYSRCFYNQLSMENKKWMDLFSNERYSLKNAIIKTFYPKRWRPTLSSEVAMRLLMIMGKV